MSIVHGGNVYEVAFRMGFSPDELLDYSASINPLGPPRGLLDEIEMVYHRLQHYPDIKNVRLVQAISQCHEMPPECIAVGNGSTELIYWLPRALDLTQVAVILPTFGEYRKAFEMQKGSIHKIFTIEEDNFLPRVEALEDMCRREAPQAVLFTHPGSPAGTTLPMDVKDWIVEKSRSDKMFCIVDEVFVDFCEDESLKAHVRNGAPGLILIRSLTKFYGIPGLRLGYLFASQGVIERVKSHLPPWSVNTLAQTAGCFCLNREEYRRKTLALVETERERLRERLTAMGCFKVFPGRANYLLARLGPGLPPAGVMCRDLLLRSRLLIRDCSSFEGLDDRYVRFAVRTPDQNDVLLRAVEHWVR